MDEEKIREVIRSELESLNDIDRSTVTTEQVREIFREEFPNALAKSLTTIEGDLRLLEGRNIIVGGTTGSKIATATTQRLGFWNQSPTTQPTALTAQVTSITHTAPGTPDYAIQDLTQTTPFGFVTKDEGNTVLKVVLNLQTRVQELETKLESTGLIASN